MTTVEDVVDFGGAMTIAQLPGPDGRVSFREALTATNNTPGPQTVEFAIPQSDWWLWNDVALLKLEQGVFFVTDDGTTIDYTTQTAFTGNTNPNGPEVGIYGLQPNGLGTPAIGILADDCTIRGLGPVLQRVSAVWIARGTGNRVVGCVTSVIEIGPAFASASMNVIGGTTPQDGNVLDAVAIYCGSDDNVVIGNMIKAVQIEGSPFCSSPYPTRNRIGGPTPAERNVIAGGGSRSSEGFPLGQNIKVLWARDTSIEGNYIGVTPDGSQSVGQIATTGIYIADSFDTTVHNNLVSGMHVLGTNHFAGQLYGRGIWISALNADNQGVVVEGNLIGTDAAGTQSILTLNGILVDHVTGSRQVGGVRIGGHRPGKGNTIAFTQRTGVAVIGGGQATVQAQLAGNSIHSNGGLAIDLAHFVTGPDGVTQNDLGDGDTHGGNALQNFPVLIASRTSGSAVAIRGGLNSKPLRTYRLEFFASQVCNPSGHGECERYLGACRA